jgi:DNA polymerase (family 10)
MNNQQVALVLNSLADMLEIQGEVIYKVLAYRRAAENIANLGRDINELQRAGQLRSIPGVGEAIAEKLDALLTTGTFDLLDRAQVPAGVVELLRVQDVGPRKARLFWKELGVTSIAELETAAREGKLKSLPGMGAKSEAKILANVEAFKRRASQTRMPLGLAFPLSQAILRELIRVPNVLRATTAGSLRRMQETIGDLDFLVAAEEAAPVMDRFVALPMVAEIIARGPTKSSVRLQNGAQADLRVLDPKRWGTGLQYFTGSQAHNVHLREIAQKKGLSLNEYAITREKGGTPLHGEILCAEEAEVYRALGVPYIPPELRQDRGEFDREIPQLITADDILGDLQMHTTWSDGKASVEEMARAALARGYRYILITDHTQSLGVAGGLTPERLRQQRREIDAVNARLTGIRVLQGAEVEVRADGSLDFSDDVLASLDMVVAALHTGLRQERDKFTARMLAAIRHPHVDVIAHPSGRLIGERDGADLDWEAVLRAAAETRTILEINAHPSRLDLDDLHARRAIELGCKLAISTDAHEPDGLDVMFYGVAVARRAWATVEDVVNAWPLERLLSWRVEGGVQSDER